jgi:hypothetical protein
MRQRFSKHPYAELFDALHVIMVAAFVHDLRSRS